MLINQNSIFAYPVLANFTGIYKNGEFTADNEDCSYGDNYVFKFHCKLRNNDDISSLLKENKCKYACLVECSDTKFRKLYLSHSPTIDIKQPKASLCGKVEFSINIIATEDIKSFTSEFFSKGWYGRKYDFDKGAFLAIGPQLHKMLPKLNDEHHDTNNSYICILKTDKQKMSVDWDQDKVLVYLYKEIYDTYEKLKKNKTTLNLIIQMVAVPALIELLDQIKNGSNEFDEANLFDTKWYQYLDTKCKKFYTQELKEYLEENGSMLEFVEKILKSPLAIAFSSMENIFSLDDEEDD